MPEPDGHEDKGLAEAFRMLGTRGERLSTISSGIEVLLQRLDEAHASHQQLIRGIGHDLKSPLASIASMADALSDGDLGEMDEEQAACCRMIADTARRMIDHVEMLYALAAAKAGIAHSQIASCDVGSVARTITDGFRPVAEVRGLSLDFVGPLERITIGANPLVVERVIANLVDNAIKFTDRGHVAVTVSHDEASVLIEIADTGLGIAAEEHARVFDEYYRAEMSNGRPGAGIGLSVTRDLVKVLGATMSLESAVGEGSRFAVRIPLDSSSESRSNLGCG